jgi:uncharacterized protein
VDSLTKRLSSSAVLSRVAPFAIFLGLTACQGQLGEASRYWFYLAKTLVGAWLVWSAWPVVTEMRWAMSWEAVAAGVGVFVIWVGLDPFYPSLSQIAQAYLWPILKAIGLGNWCRAPGSTPPWNPGQQYGQGSALAWLFILARIAGSTLVVPPIEEVFYRSFLYRYVAKPDFESVPLGAFMWTPFLVTAGVFGISHREWLAGILCAFVYQGLVCWKKRLGDAMTAHAITNVLLGLWVVGKGAWQFW